MITIQENGSTHDNAALIGFPDDILGKDRAMDALRHVCLKRQSEAAREQVVGKKGGR